VEFEEEIAGAGEVDGGGATAGGIKCVSKRNVPPIRAAAIVPMKAQCSLLSPLLGPVSPLPLPLGFSETSFLFPMADLHYRDWLRPKPRQL
jgi:hypothetical protein